MTDETREPNTGSPMQKAWDVYCHEFHPIVNSGFEHGWLAAIECAIGEIAKLSGSNGAGARQPPNEIIEKLKSLEGAQ